MHACMYVYKRQRPAGERSCPPTNLCDECMLSSPEPSLGGQKCRPLVRADRNELPVKFPSQSKES